jgi:probable rRNA maturation factor
MRVLIKDSQRLIKTDKRRIKGIVEELLIYSGLTDKDLSILFVDNKRIRQMNKRFFQKDSPTNVISFSYMDGLPGEVAGDIIISIERAMEEAHDSDMPFYERLFALIIHGLLHIMGYDHEIGRKEAVRMRLRERKLLEFVKSQRLYKGLPSA